MFCVNIGRLFYVRRIVNFNYWGIAMIKVWVFIIIFFIGGVMAIIDFFVTKSFQSLLFGVPCLFVAVGLAKIRYKLFPYARYMGDSDSDNNDGADQ